MTGVIEWLFGLPLARMAEADSWQVGFVADYSNYVRVALVVALAALVYLTIHSYRREDHAPVSAKITLTCLRGTVLALVVAILFGPAVKLRFSDTLLSRVVLLIDDSRSMSFRDGYTTADEAEQLAGYLGVEREALAGLSRSDIVKRSLDRPDGALSRLSELHPLLVMRFSTARPGKESYTHRLIDIPARSGDSEPSAASQPVGLAAALETLKADGYETNIPAAIRDALDRTRGQQVAAIVIVSDGQITSADAAGRLGAALELAAQRGGRGVPLYAVAVGDPEPPRNLAVTALQGPREVRRKARAVLSVVLSHRNLGGEKVTLRLQRRGLDEKDWTDTQVAETVTLKRPQPGAASKGRPEMRQIVTMYFEPVALGKFVYRVSARPLPSEANTEDNAAEARMDVTDEKAHVLLIAGSAGWEFQYLRSFLVQSPETYRVSVWQQNADKEVNQAASTGMKLSRLPRDLEELIGSPGGKPHPGYDAVILCDPQPTQGGFDSKFIEMLKTFVQKHGGGLCYVAGSKYGEQVLIGDGAFPDLMVLLPVSLSPNTVDLAVRMGSRRPEAWPVRITGYGVDHPIMRLAAEPGQAESVWGALPGIYWSHPVAKVKPAAKVLAEHSSPLRRTRKNQPEPIVVVQPVGAGRAVYVGSDETWRWRFVRDGYYHRRFWGNMVRYLATSKARQIVITTGGDRFTAGQKITVQVEAYDEKYQPLKAETFDVTMRKVGGNGAEKITLKAVDLKNKPGRYQARILARHTGVYELTALVDDPLAREKVRPKRIVIELPQAEGRRPEADVATMKNVASRPDNFLRIDQVDKLAELIPPGQLRTVREASLTIWDTPAMLIVLVVLLTVEWILRKKYNMA